MPEGVKLTPVMFFVHIYIFLEFMKQTVRDFPSVWTAAQSDFLWLHNLMPVDIWMFRDDFIFSTKTVLECIKCSCIISCPISQWAFWHSELCQAIPLCWNTHSGTAVSKQFSDGLVYGSCVIVWSIFEIFYEYLYFICFNEGKICSCF